MKKLQGKVISIVGSKSIGVLVSKKQREKQYSKVLNKNRKFIAHDETNNIKIGDIVVLDFHSKPISKTKSIIAYIKND